MSLQSLWVVTGGLRGRGVTVNKAIVNMIKNVAKLDVIEPVCIGVDKVQIHYNKIKF